MEKFIIPVTEVKMTGEDFDATRSAILELENENKYLEGQVNKMGTFITRILSLIEHERGIADIIDGDSDYDIRLVLGASEKPTMYIQVKK